MTSLKTAMCLTFERSNEPGVRSWCASFWKGTGASPRAANASRLAAKGGRASCQCNGNVESSGTIAHRGEKASPQAMQRHGSVNIEGGPTFHALTASTGHLSHQIEHPLFPDIPASRYPEMAPRVRELCERYGQSYDTG